MKQFKIKESLDKMQDAMIDLESIGVETDAALTQISAVQFNPFTGQMGSEFNRVIDLKSSLDAGLSISAGSIKFWLTHPSVTQEARDVVMSKTGDQEPALPEDSLSSVLADFKKWIKENDIRYIHGNGSASDNVWVRSAYKAIEMEPAFTFRDDICFRSLKTMAKRTGWKDEVEFIGVVHNGIDDAKHQVHVLSSILEHFGMNVQDVDIQVQTGE